MSPGKALFGAVLTALPAAAALGFGLAERKRPLRVRKRSTLKRGLVNTGLAISGAAVSLPAVRPVARRADRWSREHEVGLAPALPAWSRGIAGFLLLDFSYYLWHRANHHGRLLWRFHNVHHVDPELDMFTALRFHFGELAASVLVRAAQANLIGPSATTKAVYDAAFTVANLFHHANLDLGDGVERRLQRWIITPRLHGVHHSVVAAETHSNFGVVLSVWDRLFGTLRPASNPRNIEIGVPAYRNPQDNKFVRLFAMPFQKQRAYFGEAILRA